MLNLLTFRDAAPRTPRRADAIVVCHPIWELAYGGTERQLAQVLPRMAEGFEHVVLPRGGTAEQRQPTPPGVTLVEARAGTLAGQLRRMKADVVHVRGLGSLPEAVSAARQARHVPVVFSFHGLERIGQRLSWLRRRWVRRALMSCSQRWAVSSSARDWIADAAGIPHDHVQVIPNGVDVDAFAPCRDKAAAKTALGFPPDRPLILSVGNIKAIKGHRVLVDAARLYQSGESPVTVIVGADYQVAGSRLAQMAQSRGVRLVGRQLDVRSWYDAADVFVLPSLFEGLSNALLEAMACGLPVVATDVGGNPDVVRSGANGLLVPAGDHAALGLAIRALMADAERRAVFGAAARETAVRSFNLDLAAARTAAAYRRAAQAQAQSGREAS